MTKDFRPLALVFCKENGAALPLPLVIKAMEMAACVAHGEAAEAVRTARLELEAARRKNLG